MKDSEKFISWLKYLDIEYLDETTWNQLSEFDINDPADWSSIIDLALRDEVASFSPVSQVSMMAVLDNLAVYPEREVRELMGRVCMPFVAPLKNYLPFFKYARQELFGVRPRCSTSAVNGSGL